MTDSANSPEKKLFVDEDWKSQVEREKEAALHAEQSAATGKEVPPGGAQPTASAGAKAPLPPADLFFLIGTLYLQGAMALGLLANPVSSQSEVNFDQAKHAIDLLTVLQQKTEGNRTPDESEELEGALHQLRLAYVAVKEN